jgi:flagellar biosynthesis/type III secretory pathway protein FliH
MQKWFPKAFSPKEAAATPAGAGVWTPLGEYTNAGRENLFRPDNLQLGPTGLWAQMSAGEKEQVQRMVTANLEAKYAQQQQQMVAEERAKIQGMLAELAAEIRDQNQAQMQMLAQQTVKLALAMTEKIVRKAVELDADVLTRTLEAILRKSEAGNSLAVRVNPADAELLEGQPELLQKMHIQTITPDRRVERGGCRVCAGEQEWDATLASQLENLTEIVQEIMTGSFPMPERNDPEHAPVE